MTHAGDSKHGRHTAGNLVCQVARLRAGAPGVVPLAEEKSSRAVGDRITPLVVAVGSRPSEGGQGDGYQARVDLSQQVVGEAQGLQCAQGSGLDEEIRRGQEGAKRLTVGGCVQEGEDDAAFIGVGIDEGKAASGILDVAGEGRKPPIWITSGRLHLDDIGT